MPHSSSGRWQGRSEAETGAAVPQDGGASKLVGLIPVDEIEEMILCTLLTR